MKSIQRKLQAWAGVAVVMMASFAAVGCTQPQTNDILNRIQLQIPTAIAFANSAGTVVSTLDPALALEVHVALIAVNTLLPLLQSDIQAYLAHPDATLLTKIENTINEIVSHGAQALSAVSIKNTDTQNRVVMALAALQPVLMLIDGLIQQIESNSTVRANAAARTVKLSQLRREYLDMQKMDYLARANGTTVEAWFQHEAALGF